MSSRDYWNRRAARGGIDAVLDLALSREANEAYSRWATPLWAGEHEGPWLDVGCGLGRSLAHLEGSRASLVGVDLSETMLDSARSRVPRARFAQARVEALPFRSEAFPRVVCTEILLHLPEEGRRSALEELARVLAPGGRLVLTSNNAAFFLSRPLIGSARAAGYHRDLTTLGEIRRRLESHGLRLVLARGNPFHSLLSLPMRLPGLGRLARRAADRVPRLVRGPFRLASRLDRRAPLAPPLSWLATNLLAMFEKEARP